MNKLGVYLGPKHINISEVKGKKLLKNAQVIIPEVLGGELEEKVPFDIKISALFNEALRNNSIESKEAILALSGKDLIIRTFEMPNIPKEEMAGAISFEAKKYIPFKIEELLFDYQVKTDKITGINNVLFVGIKKESINKYFSIFNQLNIKIDQIEYSGFSLIRALKLAQVKGTGIIGVLSFDLNINDEANFMVLEDGFPLFSRDVNIGTDLEVLDSNGAGDSNSATYLDKIKAEIRVSLDYYQRKFPGKNIQKIFILSSLENFQALEFSMGELGIGFKFVNFAKVMGKPIAFSSAFVKGFSAALNKSIPINVKINLVEAKNRPLKESERSTLSQGELFSLFREIKLDYRFVIMGILICLLPFGYGIYHSISLNNEINTVKNSRVEVEKVDVNLNSEQLSEINTEYKKKIEQLDALVMKQLYVTPILDVIPRVIPEGTWLTNLKIDKKELGKVTLVLKGVCYLRSADKEFEAINRFLEGLRQSPDFSRYFIQIGIDSIDQVEREKVSSTVFSLSCKNYKEGN